MASRRTLEIEADLERTRQRLDLTIGRLKEELSPGQMVDHAIGALRGRRDSDYARRLGETIRDNPIPVMLLAVSLVWLMVASRRQDDDTLRHRRASERFRGDRPAPVPVPVEAAPPQPAPRVTPRGAAGEAGPLPAAVRPREASPTRAGETVP